MLLKTRGVVVGHTPNDAGEYYRVHRPFSYGSFIGEYLAHYCDDKLMATDGDSIEEVKKRMKAGVASGWKPDLSAITGAVVWYQRPQTGGNPELAKIYEPIIEHYFPDRRPLFSPPPPLRCSH